jgi:alpha-mannosidase
MVQTVRLDAHSRRLEFHCTADWHESHKVLKVLFPVTVKSLEATYDIQFGALQRPTHFNTSYDMAQFEVCAHKWADLSEYGFGVALLTESKYGYSVFDNDMRITLLRSSKLPDPNADMGAHEFAYAIMPHTGSWQEAGVVGEAYKFNTPLLWAASADNSDGQAKSDASIKSDAQVKSGGSGMATVSSKSYLSVNDSNLVIDTVKKAEDSQAIVIRLYECHGARGTAKLKTSLPFARAVFCNLLEDDGLPVSIIDGQLEIPYTPFQIISVKLI